MLKYAHKLDSMNPDGCLRDWLGAACHPVVSRPYMPRSTGVMKGELMKVKGACLHSFIAPDLHIPPFQDRGSRNDSLQAASAPDFIVCMR